MIDGPSDCFIVDTTSSIYPSAPELLGLSYLSYSCLYDRVPGITLGEEKDESLPSAGQELRLCFNCGSPDHAVSSCPDPIDRELVSLSRQLFNFFRPDLVGQETTRFYVAEGWRQQRLEWLSSYEPGVIRGSLLRDALGLREGDPGNMVEWLRNMAYWGYPPGWVSVVDPRQLVCSRILQDRQSSAAEWEPFTIFEDTEDDEEIDLSLFSLPGGPSMSLPATSSSTTSVDGKLTRWASYPNTYFSSTALSVYNGVPLGGVASSPPRVSVTFTPERRALWERILSGGLDDNIASSVPPWRLSGAFGAPLVGNVKDSVPPPPSTTPPPLPLTPSFEIVDVADDRSIVDMDVSDDSE